MFWGCSGSEGNAFVLQKFAVGQILKFSARETCRSNFKKLQILTLPAIYLFECIVYFNKHLGSFECYFPQHSHNTKANIVIYPKHRFPLTEGSPI